MLCPYCRTENAPGAQRCAACTSWITERPPVREWFRARDGKMIAGVARGLADRFGLAPALVRVLFVLATVLGLWGLIGYVALWLIMPVEPLALPPPIRTAEPARSSTGAGPGA